MRKSAPTFLYTGVVLRGIAYLLDVLIIGATWFVLFHPIIARAMPSLALAIVVVATPILYFVVGWSEFGTTLGMRLLRLKIVRAHDGVPDQSGDSLGYRRAIVRFVVFVVVSWIIPVFLMVLPIVIDSKRRGFHDRAAGTVVIRPAGRRAQPGEAALAPVGYH